MIERRGEDTDMVMQSLAWAQGTTGGGGSGGGMGSLVSLVPFVLIFVIFYFLLILPQQKRQKQQKKLLETLKKGDKIITASGIWGTIANLAKDASCSRRAHDKNVVATLVMGAVEGKTGSDSERLKQK